MRYQIAFLSIVLVCLMSSTALFGCSSSTTDKSEQCLINELPDGGLPNANDRCIHTGPVEHTCCALVAAKYDVDHQCQGPREILQCAPLEPANIGNACAWGSAESCYSKTLEDGTVEYWTTREDYSGYVGHQELIGETLDNAHCQMLLSSPPCSDSP